MSQLAASLPSAALAVLAVLTGMLLALLALRAGDAITAFRRWRGGRRAAAHRTCWHCAEYLHLHPFSRLGHCLRGGDTRPHWSCAAWAEREHPRAQGPAGYPAPVAAEAGGASEGLAPSTDEQEWNSAIAGTPPLGPPASRRAVLLAVGLLAASVALILVGLVLGSITGKD